MSRVSRRQRAHEEQAGQRKLRNLIAAILGTIVLIAVVWTIWAFLPKAEQRAEVIVQRVTTDYYYDDNRNNATRLHGIPFQKETCEKIIDVFTRYTNVVGEVEYEEKAGGNDEIWSDTRKVDLEESDLAILYVNGQIIMEGDQVSCLFPSDMSKKAPTKNLEAAIANFAKSFDGTKLLFIDAGQYSWSPNHPGRSQIPFQDKLSKVIQGISANDNLWVILSHSKNEISLTSTPARATIFSLAIQESFKSLSNNNVDINRLFKDIYDRCVSYSRNFGDPNQTESYLQHPLLFKSGQGLVSSVTGKSNTSVTLGKDKDAEDSPNDELAKTRDLQEFQLREKEDFVAWLSNRESKFEKPVELFSKLATLLEPGHDVTFSDFVQAEFAQSGQPSAALTEKRNAISAFRSNCVDLAVRNRLACHLMFLGNQHIRRLQEVVQLYPSRIELSYPNFDVSENEEYDSVKRWNEQIDSWKTKFDRDCQIYRDDFFLSFEQEDAPFLLTPFQAELLGITTQRLESLLIDPVQENVGSASESEEKDPAQRSPEKRIAFPTTQYQLQLEPREHDYPPVQNSATASSDRDPWTNARLSFEQATKKTGIRINSDGDQDPESDVGGRIELAMLGGETRIERSNVAVGIDSGELAIEIELVQRSVFRGHNFFVGRLKNSENLRYEIAVEMDADDASAVPQVDYFLTKPNAIDDGSKRETYSGDFLFYVSTPVAGNLDLDDLTFYFTARIGDDRSATTEISLRVANENKFELNAIRQEGRRVLSGGQTGLLPWSTVANGKSPIERLTPQKLPTLANLRSTFDFQLRNNSGRPFDSLDARLYVLPENIGSSADYIKINTSGPRAFWRTPTYLQNNNLTPLALASMDRLKPESWTPFKFSLPANEKDKTEEGEQPTEKVKLPEYVEITTPLLLVVFDKNISENRPLWFQLFEFEPRSPFDASAWIGKEPFRAGASIQSLGMQDFESLEKLMIPSEIPTESGVYSDPAAATSEIHFVLPNGNLKGDYVREFDVAFDNEPLLMEALEVEDLHYEQSPDSMIAMIDLLGIPNFATLKTSIENYSERASAHDSGMRTSTRGQPLKAGIKLVSAAWQPHRTGFVYQPDQQGPETIYLRRNKEANNRDNRVNIQLSLPFGDQNSSVLSKRMFSYQRGGNEKPLAFPAKRRHFIHLESFAMISVIKRHEATTNIAPNSNIDFQVNDVSGGSAKSIGSWVISTSNPNLPLRKDNIQITPDKPITNAKTTLNVDFKKVVLPTQVRIGFGDKMNQIENMTLAATTPINGQFSLEVSRLLAEQVAAGEPIRGQIVIQVEDFFGDITSTTIDVSIPGR